MHNFTYFAGPNAEFLPKLHFAAEISYDNQTELQIIKEIKEDKDKLIGKNDYVLLRVDYGELKLLDDEKKTMILVEHDLYLTQIKKIKALSCDIIGSKIRIYIFSAEKIPDRFKIGKIYHIKNISDESELSSEIIKCNELYNLENNTFANVLFSLLYLRCIKSYSDREIYFSGVYSKEIEFAVDYIENNLYNKINFSELSEKLNLSDRNFRKVFKEYIGVSPKSYMQKLRMQIAAKDLKSGELSISQISDKLGYYSPFQFSRDFKKYFDVNPSDYKQYNK